MRLLVVGSGGREHALALRLASDPGVSRIVCAPGNPGIGYLAETRPVNIAAPEALAALAEAADVDLTGVVPELPLSAGVADLFRARGLSIVGPSAAAARLES